MYISILLFPFQPSAVNCDESTIITGKPASTALFDKSLANNLDELHRKYFEYEPTETDENLIEDYKDTVRDITDLFFYNEKRLVNGRREVMIVELKSPSCAISNHEMNQAKRYAFDIPPFSYFYTYIIAYLGENFKLNRAIIFFVQFPMLYKMQIYQHTLPFQPHAGFHQDFRCFLSSRKILLQEEFSVRRWL